MSLTDGAFLLRAAVFFLPGLICGIVPAPKTSKTVGVQKSLRKVWVASNLGSIVAGGAGQEILRNRPLPPVWNCPHFKYNTIQYNTIQAYRNTIQYNTPASRHCNIFHPFEMRPALTLNTIVTLTPTLTLTLTLTLTPTLTGKQVHDHKLVLKKKTPAAVRAKQQCASRPWYCMHCTGHVTWRWSSRRGATANANTAHGNMRACIMRAHLNPRADAGSPHKYPPAATASSGCRAQLAGGSEGFWYPRWCGPDSS